MRAPPAPPVHDVHCWELLRQSPDMFGRYSPDGILLWVSQQSEFIYGRTPAEMEGRSAYEFFHPDDITTVRAAHLQALAACDIVDVSYRVIHKDGGTRWVHATGRAVRDPDTGEVLEILVSTRDVTRTVEARQQALAAEQFAASLLRHLPASAYVISLDHRFRFVNAHWERLTGRSNQEVAGLLISAVWPPELADRLIRLGEEVVARRAAIDLEIEFPMPAGKRLFHIVRFPIQDETGAVTATAGVALDITEAHQHETRRLQTEKLEAVARLAGGVAHEFNNALTVLLGYAGMIQQPNTSIESARRYASLIEAAAQQSASLVRHMLSFAGRTPGQPRTLDLRAEAERCAAALRSSLGPGIEFSLSIGPQPAPVSAHPGQVETILDALAENARQAMRGQGLFLLRVSSQPGWSILEAIDSSAGLSLDERRHLFEPFQRLRVGNEETEFGLSSAYGVCHQLGGHIEVVNAPGGGSHVTLRLPCPPSD